jgi:transposase-like protein
MTIDEILERISPPTELSKEETALRQKMIQAAVAERTCPTCHSLDRVTTIRSMLRIKGFFCTRCGYRWGLS